MYNRRQCVIMFTSESSSKMVVDVPASKRIDLDFNADMGWSSL